jgi:hypothetical protein
MSREKLSAIVTSVAGAGAPEERSGSYLPLE